MEKARKSSLLKILCYILIPILAAILVLGIFHLEFLDEYGEEENEKEYIKTEQFSRSYLNYIINRISECEREKKGYSTNFYEIKDNEKSYYYSSNRESTSYYDYTPLYMNYIIIDQKTGVMYTNVKSQNYDEEIKNIKNQSLYWQYENEKIDTNIEKLNNDNIKYNYQYIYLNLEKQSGENGNSLKDYKIYTSCNENKMNHYTAFGVGKQTYEFMINNRKMPIYAVIISSILLIAIAIYLFWAIGYKKGEEGISLNTIDNIPYEILSIIGLTVAGMFLSILINIGNIINYTILIISTICYFVCYAVCAIMGVTTIKRIKAKRFFKSFLIYKIVKWLLNKTKKYKEVVLNKVEDGKKVFWYYWGFVAISIILASTFATGLGILLLIAFWLWTFYKIREYQNQEETIKKALQDIYEGKTDIHISETELKGMLKHIAQYINDIAGGFKNAIEENLKSERLKTELITNVSHDIKTPLTSIINYVDLLKKEDIKDKKVKEYIEILDKKSQRLKKLTEDLVEASKVSSGNVQLNIEEINIKELFNQTIGEFKDRFEEKKLKIEMQVPENDVKIKADSRYMYRIIENLFSNISKYALENSRVYIDIKDEKKQIKISIKNISKEKLNISSDELMQRFVRGDKSRYTEGSGLGLSIAQSLTNLQKGKFEIKIDGDLFKVEMIW